MRPLSELHPNSPEAGAIREAFLTFLRDPHHQKRQITGALFNRVGGCCALGGLALVLHASDFAHVKDEGVALIAEVPRFGMDVADPEIKRHIFTKDLPGCAEDATGLPLGLIVDLNDQHGSTFAQIADAIEAHLTVPDLVPLAVGA